MIAGFSCNRRQFWNTLRKRSADLVQPMPRAAAPPEWLFWDADRLMPPLYAWYSVELGRRKLLPISFDPVLRGRI